MRSESEISLREAAQQALEALSEYEKSYPAVADAFKPLRTALAEDAMQRLTDVQQEMDCYGDGNVYRGQRSSDSKTQTLTINWMPAVEGPLSKAHRTSQESRQVDPVAWLIEYYDIYAKRTLQRLVFDNPKNMQGVKITAYYTTPPKREPLLIEGNEFIGDPPAPAKTWGEYFENVVTTSRLSGLRVSALANPVAHEFAGVKITEVRLPENMAMRFDGDVLVIERAHGIGGEE